MTKDSKQKNLIFIAAGGKGTRLWKTLPRLKDSGLPKSLGIMIDDRPVIAYQLDHFVKLGFQIIISFADQKSIDVFKQFIHQGRISYYDYLLNLDNPGSDPTTIDIVKSSNPHKLWDTNFEVIIITSGDVYFDSQHLSNFKKIYELEKCNVQTLCGFNKYMVALEHHFHPIYDIDNTLNYVKQDDNLPSEIICHPQFLTKRAFEIYHQMPYGTSKSEFVNVAIKRGEIFKVLKPAEYVNVNFPEDYLKIIGYLSK